MIFNSLHKYSPTEEYFATANRKIRTDPVLLVVYLVEGIIDKVEEVSG